MNACVTKDKNINDGNKKCANKFGDGVKDLFNEKCLGGTHCVYDLHSEEVINWKFDADDKEVDNCKDDLAQFFIQYTCEQHDDL